MNLKEIRREIDSIDKEVAELLNKRFEKTLEVAVEKIKMKKNVLDQNREQQVLQNVSLCADVEFQDDIKDIFTFIMQKSKERQNKIVNLAN